jgi:hypothetical protein
MSGGLHGPRGRRHDARAGDPHRSPGSEHTMTRRDHTFLDPFRPSRALCLALCLCAALLASGCSDDGGSTAGGGAGTTDTGAAAGDDGGAAGEDVADNDSGGGGGTNDAGFIEPPKPDIQLEPNDTFEAIISTTETAAPGSQPLEFDFASANLISLEGMLQISGNRGVDKIEIQIKPIEEFQTGTFTHINQEAAEAVVLYNDGSNDQSQVQWRYQAVAYEIVLDQFGDVGGRVSGTFSAELADVVEEGKMIYVLDGEFDVKRGQ